MVISNEEKRRRERKHYEKHILCFEYDSVHTETRLKIPFLFTVENISYSGMKISCSQLIEPGMVLFFRLEDHHHSRDMQVQVIWCHYHNGLYDAGVEYKDLTKEDVIFIYEIFNHL